MSIDQINDSVPSHYIGIWKRTLFESAQLIDTSSLVLWLQIDQKHIDIRIPVERVVNSQAQKIEDYTNEELALLASQQGFCGVTHVVNNACEWLRKHDFQPPTPFRDYATMVFERDDFIIEEGIDQVYLEKWLRITNQKDEYSFAEMTGFNRHGDMVTAWLIKLGERFAYIRPRTAQLPASESLTYAITQLQASRDEILDWLDFEISFGTLLNPSTGHIENSTLPFKEGTHISISI